MARADISSFRGEQFALVGLVTRATNGQTAFLSADVAVGATTLNVIATAGFPTSGTLLVAGATFNYTGVTATSFTGIPNSGVGSIPSPIPSGTRATGMTVVDLRAVTSVVFTCKRTRAGAALVTKGVGSGITIPSGAPGNAYSVAIASTDTSAFTKSELLDYEIRMTETNNDVTVIVYGSWRVELGAS